MMVREVFGVLLDTENWDSSPDEAGVGMTMF